MAARTRLASAIKGARMPIALAVVWALIGIASENWLPDTDAVEGLFLTVRAAIICAAGWFAIRGSDRGLWTAALIGALALFAEYVLVSGAACIVIGDYWAFWGVMVSYLM